ncbi:MAG TPA: hypothetical protein VMV50_03275 [Candidatus Paceibacterota bacterium]|nr:hypothetical protein [Candidatus Paceibacterota bacterium]
MPAIVVTYAAGPNPSLRHEEDLRMLQGIFPHIDAVHILPDATVYPHVMREWILASNYVRVFWSATNFSNPAAAAVEVRELAARGVSAVIMNARAGHDVLREAAKASPRTAIIACAPASREPENILTTVDTLLDDGVRGLLCSPGDLDVLHARGRGDAMTTIVPCEGRGAEPIIRASRLRRADYVLLDRTVWESSWNVETIKLATARTHAMAMPSYPPQHL